MYCAYVNYICNRRLVRVHVARLAFRPRQRRSYSHAFAVLANTHTHTHLVYSPVSSLRNCRLVLSTFKPSCCPVLLSQLPLSPRQRDAGKKEAGAPFGYGRAICFLLIRYDRVEPLRNRQEQQSMENNSAGTQCCAAYCGLSCGCCVHSLRLQAGIMACIQPFRDGVRLFGTCCGHSCLPFPSLHDVLLFSGLVLHHRRPPSRRRTGLDDRYIGGQRALRATGDWVSETAGAWSSAA